MSATSNRFGLGMRRQAAIVSPLVALVSACGMAGPIRVRAAGQANRALRIIDFAFQPSTSTIVAGTSVT